MGDTEQYITVAEYAKRKGISKQAVYKQLNNKLKVFVNLVDGKKLIDIKALQDFNSTKVEQLSTEVEQPYLQKQIEEKDKVIQQLLEQITTLQEQNGRLTEQNGKLTDLLSNSQLLLAMEQKKQLEQGNPPTDKTEIPKEKKRKFFDIFRKKVDSTVYRTVSII